MVSELEQPRACPGAGGWLDLSPHQVVSDARGGAREVHFGPLPVPPSRRPSWLRLVNLAPQQLTRLWLLDGHSACYQLGSRIDAIGRTTSAGELLLAMARMDGWNDLVADLRGLRCIGGAMRVLCGVAQLSLEQGRRCRLQLSCF